MIANDNEAKSQAQFPGLYGTQGECILARPVLMVALPILGIAEFLPRKCHYANSPRNSFNYIVFPNKKKISNRNIFSQLFGILMQTVWGLMLLIITMLILFTKYLFNFTYW